MNWRVPSNTSNAKNYAPHGIVPPLKDLGQRESSQKPGTFSKKYPWKDDAVVQA